MSRKVYRLKEKRSGPGQQFMSYDLGVPTDIGDALAVADIRQFTVELTEDGILYRPVVLATPTIVEPPSWLRAR